MARFTWGGVSIGVICVYMGAMTREKSRDCNQKLYYRGEVLLS